MLDVSWVSRLAASRTRSFCPENPHGESGRAAMAEVGAASRAARDLGRGWGEGEVKFWLDDDEDFPTVASTGLEDYMGGAWNFDVDGYQTYTTPYLGLSQVIRPDGLYVSQQRFGMYRWHVPDPIRFARRLGRVDVQALGWFPDGRYKPLADDIASTCWFYLDRPSTARPTLPSRDALSV